MSGQLWADPNAGIIATLRHGEGVRSFHFPGSQTEAMRRMVEWCETFGLTVVSISTPASIFRDLQGTRESFKVGKKAADGWYSNARPGGRGLDFPERNMLGKLGRADLFEAPRG